GSIMPNQYLSRVNLEVIDNSMCSWVFPGILQPTNLCTSGVGGVGTCRGDSGGPLVITRNNRRILIGITSFGSGFGCEIGFPAAYARVTSFIDFFNKHI
ncbi:brachyurin-like, partial [Bombyx mandarina]|uniref:Brachyurin-like n=1 Tax=Bombyx mandarina TaxID=7092 RepID=A0A6J2JDA2_BOMMA